VGLKKGGLPKNVSKKLDGKLQLNYNMHALEKCVGEHIFPA
jgi:hypothetical protein